MIPPLRPWQTAALAAINESSVPSRLVCAVMGAGKSVLIGALCGKHHGPVVVAAPTEALVEQLSADLSNWHPGRVGVWYGREKTPDNEIIVACYPSLDTLVLQDQPVLILDEAHLTSTEQMRDAVRRLQPVLLIGLTATPFRGDGKPLDLFEEVVYSYTISDGLRDGVLVPWETVHPDEGNRDLDEVCLEMLAIHEPQGPGIIGASSIEDAELFAEALASIHIKALPIHSEMPPKQKQAALGALKSGAIRALVHVDMLTTGVNIPWLSWLMLRRRYTSATSFLQFFGRGLRAWPGKAKCTVFDPWMQLQQFSMDYAAQLGTAAKVRQLAPAETPPDEQAFFLLDLPPFFHSAKIPPITCQRAAGAWVRAVLHAQQAAGLGAPTDWQAEGAEWRTRAATQKQLDLLAKLRPMTRHLPRGAIRDGVKHLLAYPGGLRAGVASDLADILGVGARAGAPYRKHHTHWEWSSPVIVPELPKRVRQGLK